MQWLALLTLLPQADFAGSCAAHAQIELKQTPVASLGCWGLRQAGDSLLHPPCLAVAEAALPAPRRSACLHAAAHGQVAELNIRLISGTCAYNCIQARKRAYAVGQDNTCKIWSTAVFCSSLAGPYDKWQLMRHVQPQIPDAIPAHYVSHLAPCFAWSMQDHRDAGQHCCTLYTHVHPESPCWAGGTEAVGLAFRLASHSSKVMALSSASSSPRLLLPPLLPPLLQQIDTYTPGWILLDRVVRDADGLFTPTPFPVSYVCSPDQPKPFAEAGLD